MYRSCLTIIKSCYFDCTINKPFTCSRCVICVSCSVHVISTWYVRKGSWAFYLNYPANQRGWGILSVELTDTVLFVWRLVGKTATQSSWWELVAVLPSCTPPTESWHAISSTRLKVTFNCLFADQNLNVVFAIAVVLVVLIVICCCCCCCCWWWWWWWWLWWRCHCRFRSWGQLPLSKWFGLLNTLTQTEIQMKTHIQTDRQTQMFTVLLLFVCCVSLLFLCAL